MSTSEEFSFLVGPFEMAGQIDFPLSENIKFPTALIIPSSPPHDRYGNVKGYPGYKNYLQILAKRILKSGYAVVRYDKGGTGKSSSGLSAGSNLVSAYRKLCQLQKVDLTRIAICAIGGGSAQFYRNWSLIQEINPIQQLILMSTGINDLKIEDFDFPICLISGEGKIFKSKGALQRYEKRTGNLVLAYEAIGANEQLCQNENNQANLFKDGGCIWHEGALNTVTEWFSKFVN